MSQPFREDSASHLKRRARRSWVRWSICTASASSIATSRLPSSANPLHLPHRSTILVCLPALWRPFPRFLQALRGVAGRSPRTSSTSLPRRAPRSSSSTSTWPATWSRPSSRCPPPTHGALRCRSNIDACRSAHSGAAGCGSGSALSRGS